MKILVVTTRPPQRQGLGAIPVLLYAELIGRMERHQTTLMTLSQSVVQNADPLAAFCAIGGSRSVWEYYIDKPIEYPLTLAELQEFSNTYPEVRCVYYPAFWQDEGQTEIAQYLFRHASYFRVKELR